MKAQSQQEIRMEKETCKSLIKSNNGHDKNPKNTDLQNKMQQQEQQLALGQCIWHQSRRG